ncbi:hypothetical protein H0H81_002423 [Sphagnurus paluster]|uniref:Uncharacterized protein n=1 Tax=Sphagnurus paluster TaxID=117069 RepID=A0A9P7GMM6_9AGAR|nr:hypothetical protein H0H81_002423 [Sphagnurus paluster]
MNVPPNVFPLSSPSPGQLERSPTLGTKPTSSRVPVPSSLSATPLPAPCKLFSEGFLRSPVYKGPLRDSVTKVTEDPSAIIVNEGTSAAKDSTPKLPDVEGTAHGGPTSREVDSVHGVTPVDQRPRPRWLKLKVMTPAAPIAVTTDRHAAAEGDNDIDELALVPVEGSQGRARLPEPSGVSAAGVSETQSIADEDVVEEVPKVKVDKGKRRATTPEGARRKPPKCKAKSVSPKVEFVDGPEVLFDDGTEDKEPVPVEKPRKRACKAELSRSKARADSEERSDVEELKPSKRSRGSPIFAPFGFTKKGNPHVRSAVKDKRKFEERSDKEPEAIWNKDGKSAPHQEIGHQWSSLRGSGSGRIFASYNSYAGVSKVSREAALPQGSPLPPSKPPVASGSKSRPSRKIASLPKKRMEVFIPHSRTGDGLFAAAYTDMSVWIRDTGVAFARPIMMPVEALMIASTSRVSADGSVGLASEVVLPVDDLTLAEVDKEVSSLRVRTDVLEEQLAWEEAELLVEKGRVANSIAILDWFNARRVALARCRDNLSLSLLEESDADDPSEEEEDQLADDNEGNDIGGERSVGGAGDDTMVG